MSRIYLDYNATTPIDPRVSDTFAWACDLYGNPSSMVESGRRAKEAIESSRERLARFIGADPWQILFSHSGSEGNNQVLKTILFRALAEKKSAHLPVHIIISAIEHASIMKTARWMAGFDEIELTVLDVDSGGFIDPAAVESAIRPNTRLVSIMAANNEIGSIQPIGQIAPITRQKGILFHVDAVQALGKLPIQLSEWPVDLMTFSSHKCYAPKGVGALFVRDDALLAPLIHGGSQEHQLIAGTENVPGVVAFGAAIDLLSDTMMTDQARIRRLADRLEVGILSRIQDVHLNHPADNRLAGTVNVSFQGVSGESLMVALDMAGVEVSTGSACSTGSIDPSHVLSAVCPKKWMVMSGIRFSIGRFTTEDEIDQALERLVTTLARCRSASSRSSGSSLKTKIKTDTPNG